MNELQMKLAKRRQVMGDESVVQTTTDAKTSFSPPSPSKFSLRTPTTEKPSSHSASKVNASPSTNTPIKDSIKLFEKSKTPTTGGNNDDDNSNSNKSPSKPTPGKLKQFGLGLGINMNAFNPNAPRPSFTPKPSSSLSSSSTSALNTTDTETTLHHSSTGETIATVDGDKRNEVPKSDMKHPTMKRPMVGKQMRRLSSLKKMDLKVLNHEVDPVMDDDGENYSNNHGDINEGRKSAISHPFIPVLETISSSTDDLNPVRNDDNAAATITDANPRIINNIIDTVDGGHRSDTPNATAATTITTNATTAPTSVISTTTPGDNESKKTIVTNSAMANVMKVNFDEKCMEDKNIDHSLHLHTTDHHSLVRLNSALTSYDSFKTAHDSESVKQYNDNDDDDDDDDDELTSLKNENQRLLDQVKSLKNELYQRDAKVSALESDILIFKQNERSREEKSLLLTPSHKRSSSSSNNATPDHKRGVGGRNRSFNNNNNDDDDDDDGDNNDDVDMLADSKHVSYTNSSGSHSGRLGSGRSGDTHVLAATSEEKLSGRRRSSSSSTTLIASKAIDDDGDDDGDHSHDNTTTTNNNNNDNTQSTHKERYTAAPVTGAGAAGYQSFGFKSYTDVMDYFSKPSSSSVAVIPVTTSTTGTSDGSASTIEKLQTHKLNIMSAMSFTIDDDDANANSNNNNNSSSSNNNSINDSSNNNTTTTIRQENDMMLLHIPSESDYQSFIAKLHHKDSAALMFFIKRFLSSILSTSSSSSGGVSRENSRPSSPSKSNSTDFTSSSLSSLLLEESTTGTSALSVTRRPSSVFVGTVELASRYADFIDSMMTHFHTHASWRDPHHHNNENDEQNNINSTNNDSSTTTSLTLTSSAATATATASSMAMIVDRKWCDIQYCLEKYLMSHIYDVSWKYIKQHPSSSSLLNHGVNDARDSRMIMQRNEEEKEEKEEEDVVLSRRIQSLAFLTPKMLHITPATLTRIQQQQQSADQRGASSSSSSSSSVQSAVEALAVLNEFKTPSDKARCLIQCISILYCLINPHSASHSASTATSTNTNNNNDDDDEVKSQEFMSLLLYVIIQSKVSDLSSNRNWMTAFYHSPSSSSSRITAGSMNKKHDIDSIGYCLDQFKRVIEVLLQLPLTPSSTTTTTATPSSSTTVPQALIGKETGGIVMKDLELLLPQIALYVKLDTKEQKTEFESMYIQQAKQSMITSL